jgi:chemotaxis protein CheD
MNQDMLRTVAPVEIYLKPGEFHFGGGNTRIHTLLGSCISITLWHPFLHVGGMCHFMLPSRNGRPSSGLDGRYADEAMQLFVREIGKCNTRPDEYRAKLFGGGNMFRHLGAGKFSDVAERNIEAGRILLQAGGFHIQAEDVGGDGHRRVIFYLSDGNVWVRHEKI